MPVTAAPDVLAHFATLLSYPGPALAPAARACAAAVGDAPDDAAALVAAFAAFVDATPPGRLEEIYTAHFELDASAPPYVGHHLFGESYKRSVFLFRLRAACRAAGVDPGGELPDHLTVILRLLAATGDEELRADLVEAALLPVLARLTGEQPTAAAAAPPDDDTGAAGDAEPAVAPDDAEPARAAYAPVLRALRLVLARPAVAAAGEGGS